MPDTSPALPEHPALRNDDSMLTRRFGKEVINYYAGARLNRFSVLRPDAAFLRIASASPTSHYLALHSLNPLTNADQTELAYLKFDDVKPLVGSDPFRADEAQAVKEFDSTKKSPLLVFLGVLEDPNAAESFPSKHGDIKGHPYFAVDITPTPGEHEAAATALLKKAEEKGLVLQDNPRAMSLQAESAAIYAGARSMVDWNTRHPFCAGCGQPNLSVHGGWKRVCPTTDLKGGSTPQDRRDCPTRHGLSNIYFPRTDPTMIVAVVSSDGQRVLLGRQSRWPPNWHSALAGFLEPGESLEEAVRREVWEEAGVQVGRVVIHSTQPWPYPSSLMIGAVAQALPGEGEKINLNDQELEAARWFEMSEVREALRSGTGPLGGSAPAGYKEGALRLPPKTAIANQIITSVTEGFVTGFPKM